MESLLFMLNSIAVLIVAYMGVRDDRRPPGSRQTSIFRTLDDDAIRSNHDAAQARQDRVARTRVR